MEKEKQIEEMAKLMCENSRRCYELCGNCYGEKDNFYGCKGFAELFYNAGYGDTKQAVKEFAARVKAKFYANSVSRTKGYKEERVCDLTVDEFNGEIDELVKEVCGD